MEKEEKSNKEKVLEILNSYLTEARANRDAYIYVYKNNGEKPYEDVLEWHKRVIEGAESAIKWFESAVKE
jgi:hypothetical protein